MSQYCYYPHLAMRNRGTEDHCPTAGWWWSPSWKSRWSNADPTLFSVFLLSRNVRLLMNKTARMSFLTSPLWWSGLSHQSLIRNCVLTLLGLLGLAPVPLSLRQPTLQAAALMASFPKILLEYGPPLQPMTPSFFPIHYPSVTKAWKWSSF